MNRLDVSALHRARAHPTEEFRSLRTRQRYAFGAISRPRIASARPAECPSWRTSGWSGARCTMSLCPDNQMVKGLPKLSGRAWIVYKTMRLKKLQPCGDDLFRQAEANAGVVG